MKITPHYKQIASVLFILVLSKTFKNLMVIRLPARQLFKRNTDLPFPTEYSLVHGGWVLELWDPPFSHLHLRALHWLK